MTAATTTPPKIPSVFNVNKILFHTLEYPIVVLGAKDNLEFLMLQNETIAQNYFNSDTGCGLFQSDRFIFPFKNVSLNFNNKIIFGDKLSATVMKNVNFQPYYDEILANLINNVNEKITNFLNITLPLPITQERKIVGLDTIEFEKSEDDSIKIFSFGDVKTLNFSNNTRVCPTNIKTMKFSKGEDVQFIAEMKSKVSETKTVPKLNDKFNFVGKPDDTYIEAFEANVDGIDTLYEKLVTRYNVKSELEDIKMEIDPEFGQLSQQQQPQQQMQQQMQQQQPQQQQPQQQQQQQKGEAVISDVTNKNIVNQFLGFDYNIIVPQENIEAKSNDLLDYNINLKKLDKNYTTILNTEQKISDINSDQSKSTEEKLTTVANLQNTLNRLNDENNKFKINLINSKSKIIN